MGTVSNVTFDINRIMFDFNDIKDKNELIDNIANFIEKNIALSIFSVTEINIDYSALKDVLERYSKDIYGLFRIEKMLSLHIDKKTLGEIIEDIKNSSGLMVETLSPHPQKRIAYLCYHLEMLKPFSAVEVNNDKENKTDNIMKYFNELVTYCLIKIISKNLGYVFNIKDDRIHHFIHSLRYRRLGRSSLELLFENLIIK